MQYEYCKSLNPSFPQASYEEKRKKKKQILGRENDAALQMRWLMSLI